MTAAARIARPYARTEALDDVQALAAFLNVAPAWVYEHASELGAIRLGDGPKARLRFDRAQVLERLSACSAGRESESPKTASPVASRPRRRHGSGTSVDLLPIRGGFPASGRAA